MLNLWNSVNEEVLVSTQVEVIKISTKEDLDFLGCYLVGGDLTYDKPRSNSATLISECIQSSPFIIDGHNESNKFNLSSGDYVLYVLANSSIGFGVIGKIHCINSLLVSEGELHLSTMSIGGTVMNREKSIDALVSKVERMNSEITSDGLKVEKIIYFAE